VPKATIDDLEIQELVLKLDEMVSLLTDAAVVLVLAVVFEAAADMQCRYML
jgi:hypothetical protein